MSCLSPNQTGSKLSLLILLGFSLAGLSACNAGGGSARPYDGQYRGVNEAMRSTWHNVYGEVCGINVHPSAGCNFYEDGTKISALNDTYRNAQQYSDNGCWPDCPDHVGDGNWESVYRLSNRLWEYTDPFGVRIGYQGWAWMSPTGIIYDANGVALNEQEAGVGRDLMTSIAEGEEAMAQAAASRLSDQFALAEASSLRIARTLGDWATLGRKHGRTKKDLEDFSRRLYGVELNQATAVLSRFAATRDMADLEGLNEDIATAWGTDPEISKTVLLSWYGKFLGQAAR